MKLLLIPLMIFSLFANMLSAGLTVGSDAPQISAIDHTGNTIDLGAAFNTGTTVVFFYPKAMTPGCTKQACSLRDSWEVLQQRGVTIFGISADTAKTQDHIMSIIGLVVDMGEQAYGDEERFPTGPWCKEGDFVMFRMNSGTRFTIGGIEYRLMNDDSIEAVVADPTGIQRA